MTGADIANAESHRPGDARQALKQPVFNWKGPSKYIELLKFEMAVINTLHTRSYKPIDEEKVSVIKNLARKGGTTVHTNTHKFQIKRHVKQQKGCLKCPMKIINYSIIKLYYHYNTVSEVRAGSPCKSRWTHYE